MNNKTPIELVDFMFQDDITYHGEVLTPRQKYAILKYLEAWFELKKSFQTD